MQSTVSTRLGSSLPAQGFRVAPVPRMPTTSPTAPARDVVVCAKKKGIRLIVTLECTEARGLGETPSRYVTQKNRKNTAERLELRKYNPFLRRHTVHKEIK
mmetsp:Transcript_12789/g.34879  ORF Transcript_12789/g.34879 Transcript_12789/m.34879 type:complete len:101 (-) Transcript_12789:596-898(-)